MLNVGPTDKGTFPPEAIERLAYIGRWMEANEESIRGTTYTPLHNLPFGRATRKQDKLYLHIMERPDNGVIEIRDFPWKASAVRGGSGEAVTFSQADRELRIELQELGSSLTMPVLVVDL